MGLGGPFSVRSFFLPKYLFFTWGCCKYWGASNGKFAAPRRGSKLQKTGRNFGRIFSRLPGVTDDKRTPIWGFRLKRDVDAFPCCVTLFWRQNFSSQKFMPLRTMWTQTVDHLSNGPIDTRIAFLDVRYIRLRCQFDFALGVPKLKTRLLNNLIGGRSYWKWAAGTHIQ